MLKEGEKEVWNRVLKTKERGWQGQVMRHEAPCQSKRKLKIGIQRARQGVGLVKFSHAIIGLLLL